MDDIIVKAPRGPDPLYMQDKNFIEAIKRAEEPLVTGIDGFKALKVCEALIEAADTNTPINIHIQQ